MPFNEKGEWVNLNPYEEYKHKVIISREQPGSGGIMWTSEHRNMLHDEATFYLMEQEGIPLNPENFLRFRERISRELDQNYDFAERSGIVKEPLSPPQRPQSLFYNHIGD